MRGLAQGDVANNFERESFQSCYFWGMVRQQLYTTQAQVMKYLCSDAVISIGAIARLQTRFALANVAFLHDRISAQLINQVKTVFSLAQIKDHTSPGRSDFLQRRVQLKPRVVYQ